MLRTRMLIKRPSHIRLLKIAIEYLLIRKKTLHSAESDKYLKHLNPPHHLIVGQKTIIQSIQIYFLHNWTDFELNTQILKNLIVLPPQHYVSKFESINRISMNDLNDSMKSNAKSTHLSWEIRLVWLSQYLIVRLQTIKDFLRGLLISRRIMIAIKSWPSIKYWIATTLSRS